MADTTRVPNDLDSFWMPFTAISSLRFEPPADLRDAVWTAGSLTLQNGGEFAVMIPTRYPATTASEDGAAMLARRTDWADAGAETFTGIGQRLLATDGGDTALLDIRSLEIDVQPEAEAAGDDG